MRKVFIIILLFLCLAAKTIYAQTPSSITIRSIGPDGNMLPRTNQIYLSTLNYEPRILYGDISSSKTFSNLDSTPLMFSAYIEVPGFGNLDFTANNNGQGYIPTGQTIDVLYEIAKNRLFVIDKLVSQSQIHDFDSQIQQAKVKLDQGLALESLIISGPVGENLVIQKGKQILNSQGKLNSDQYLSTFTYYANREGSKFIDNAKKLFTSNVSFNHWQGTAQADGSFAWPNDNSQFLFSKTRMTPGAWFNSFPSWISATPGNWEIIKNNLTSYAEQIVKKYPQIQILQVLSEPHSWANQGFITPDNFAELVSSMSKSVKTSNPNIRVAVNTALNWGEDAAFNLNHSPDIISPSAFYDKLAQNNINFDAITLQLYPSGRDMLEHELLLENFARFHKPIHIELSAPSQNTAMPGHERPEFCQGTSDCRHPSQKYYSWHGGWNPENQSLWLEDMFYILMSKPYVKEFNWWDLADYADVYIPWGGLMDANYQPKPSYNTLLSLIQKYVLTLPGDVNKDTRVDIFDFNLLLADYSKSAELITDLNSDGKVNLLDAAVVIANFGKTL